MFNFTLFSILLCLANLAQATCGPCPEGLNDWRTAAKVSKKVFAAKLVSVESVGFNKKGIFHVTKSFRGSVPDTLNVYDHKVDCEQPLSDFAKDTVYLFVADSFQEYGNEKDIFHPSTCTKAIREKENLKIVKWLSSKEFKKFGQ